MTLPLARPTWPLGAFLVLTALAYTVALGLVVPALATVPHPERLAAALVADLVVLVPLAYAVLVVRVGGWRTRTILPVVALSAGVAWWVLPDGYGGAVRGLAIALPLLEVGALLLTAAALIRAVRSSSGGDPADRIEAATVEALGDHAGSRAIAFELSLLRYAAGPTVVPSPGAFSIRRGNGGLLAGVLVAAFVEMVGGHLLVRHLWGDTAALVHLALSGYAILWLVGDWRALGARTVTVEGDTLRIRTGLRWSLDVPIDRIEAVYRVRGALPTDAPIVDASVLSPRLILVLREPVVARGLYGVRREAARVALGVDDPERLLARLSARLSR